VQKKSLAIFQMGEGKEGGGDGTGATPTNIFIISFSWKFAFFCCVALCCACHFRFALCHFAISGFDGSTGISIP